MVSTNTLSRDVVDQMIKTAVENATEAQKKHIAKLNEENKNKRLTNKEILDALGVTKEEGKSEMELVNERLAAQQATVEELTKKLADKERDAELMARQSQAKSIAAKYNFYNPDDALAGLDYEGDIENQIKKKVEANPHYIKKQDVGNGFGSIQGENPKDLESQYKEALRNGNASLAISLKNKLHGII